MMLHPHSAHSPSTVETVQHYIAVARSSRVLVALSLVLLLLTTVYLIAPSTSPSTLPLTTQPSSSSTPSSPTPPIVAHHSTLPSTPTSHTNPGLSKTVHLPPSLVPNLQQFAVARFAAGSRTERHVHPTLTEVFHVKEGRGRFEFDDGTVEEVGVDDTIAVPAGAYHVVSNQGTDTLVMVYASILV